jgi:hypothetical protein
VIASLAYSTMPFMDDDPPFDSSDYLTSRTIHDLQRALEALETKLRVDGYGVAPDFAARMNAFCKTIYVRGLKAGLEASLESLKGSDKALSALELLEALNTLDFRYELMMAAKGPDTSSN